MHPMHPSCTPLLSSAISEMHPYSEIIVFKITELRWMRLRGVHRVA
jgi:hypothetical protein